LSNKQISISLKIVKNHRLYLIQTESMIMFVLEQQYEVVLIEADHKE